MALADQIPVTIGQGKEALRIARERLAMGNTVVIFPEGHLNHGEHYAGPAAGRQSWRCKAGHRSCDGHLRTGSLC